MWAGKRPCVESSGFLADEVIPNNNARWQYAWGRESNAPRGPFLELAYWIGPEPGVSTQGDVQYDQYRDLTGRSSQFESDVWVVFHMHVNPQEPNWLMSHDGHTYMGIPGFRVFHGQVARPFSPSAGAWRVDGNLATNPLTARRGWDCPESEGGYWYVGYPDTPTTTQYERMQRWGEMLWNEGYVSTPGLRLIVEPPEGDLGGEVDPERPGYVVRPPSGYTTAAGNQNPYELNFLIENGMYSFVTEPHPPPPSKK